MDDIKNIERRAAAKKMIEDGFEKNSLINLAIGSLEECLANEDIIYLAVVTNNNIFSLNVIKLAIDTYGCCGDSSKSFVNMIIKHLNKIAKNVPMKIHVLFARNKKYIIK